jgi:hypothetical protein
MPNLDIADETLMAYADGELTAAERARIESALESDPSLRERLEIFTQSAGLARDAYEEILDRPVPTALIAAIERAAAEPSNVAQFPKRTAEIRRYMPRWTVAVPALAASLALIFALNSRHDEPVKAAALSGACATANYGGVLDKQPSGVPTDAGTSCNVMAIASYEQSDGALCRSFEALDTAAAQASNALACHTKKGWELIGVAALDIGKGSSDSFKPASGTAVDEIAVLRKAQGLGQALSDDAERAALAGLTK